MGDSYTGSYTRREREEGRGKKEEGECSHPKSPI